MYKIMLNKAKSDNYVFFCPDAPIHLNLCQPIGYVGGLTSSILRGIKGGTLIDCDNLLGTLDKEEVIEDVKEDKVDVSEIKKDEVSTPKEEEVEEVKEVKKKTTKRTSKKKVGE